MTNVEPCIYCDSRPSGDDDAWLSVPAVDDDDAWLALAAIHATWCEWIRTRAHRLSR